MDGRQGMAGIDEKAGRSLVLFDGQTDNSPRHGPGARFEALFAQVVRDMGEAARNPAVEAGGASFSFAELEALANRMARHLAACGVQPGAVVAILLKGSAETYAAMLAVLKCGAAFVPLDSAFPADRIAYILGDSSASHVICATRDLGLVEAAGAAVIDVEAQAAAIAAHSAEEVSTPQGASELCYVIYTSGTTGRPKGVVIDHAMLANFVAVAAGTYGLHRGARMYQGLTIAFDFAVEEIWVPLFCGATLVPPPDGVALVGADLARFLEEARIDALCCVPTLLATLEDDAPGLRFLLVSGEACPADLVTRWWRQDRVFLNAYGPTETTVTATLGRPLPGRPVTIGKPLPTYGVLIRDPENGAFLGQGATGEIVISGPGVSRGYLNRPDLTAKAFIDDPIGVAHNPGGKLYRTGDLGRVNADGEVEYLGRIDTQVKIRGYRIETGEIESVLMSLPGIAQAAVDKVTGADGGAELAAWYSLRSDAEAPEPGQIAAALRERLPAFMTPAYLTPMPMLPMLVSGKVDRSALPKPAQRVSLGADGGHESPHGEWEEMIAACITAQAGVASPSATAHFFDAMGLNSLIIARVSAAVRRARPASAAAMKDFYLNPDIRSLASALAGRSGHAARERERLPLHLATPFARWATGLCQVAVFMIYVALVSEVWFVAFRWAEGAATWSGVYWRSVSGSSGVFLFLCALPVAIKWLVSGRMRPGRFAAWSPAYFRFWVVKQAIRLSPLAAFPGTPLFNLYLRALGARIGSGAVTLKSVLPACPDLLEIGERAVVGKESVMLCYRAEAGWIETGPVRIGAGATVGEMSVLDIGTTVGDGAALAHASCLLRGQAIPTGQSWHGSPAIRADVDYRADTSRTAPAWRRAAYTGAQLAALAFVILPAPFGALVVLDSLGGGAHFDPMNATGHPVAASLAAYLAMLALGLAWIGVAPRLAMLALRPGEPFPLYGLRHFAARLIERAGASRAFNMLFGDSSYILHYLRYAGMSVDLSPESQTGSNFGLVQRFDNLFMTDIGKGAMASDGLAVGNLRYDSWRAAAMPVALGERSFIGNHVLFPPGHRTGADCLFASRVMVPLDGPVRSGIGLLGSPPFEIPRAVMRDRMHAEWSEPAARAQRIRLKNRSNLITIGLYLLTRWLGLLIAWMSATLAFDLYPAIGPLAWSAGTVAGIAAALLMFVATERVTTGFRPLQPRECSIYDGYYWRHERYWKLNDSQLINALNGTPFKAWFWRLCGVRCGAGLLDLGALATERSLTALGDNVTLNEMALLQGHSLEEGIFKSAHIRIGAGATVGVKAYVHYGADVGEQVVVEADSFLMKGEAPAAGEIWAGNPARRAG